MLPEGWQIINLMGEPQVILFSNYIRSYRCQPLVIWNLAVCSDRGDSFTVTIVLIIMSVQWINVWLFTGIGIMVMVLWCLFVFLFFSQLYDCDVVFKRCWLVVISLSLFSEDLKCSVLLISVEDELKMFCQHLKLTSLTEDVQSRFQVFCAFVFSWAWTVSSTRNGRQSLRRTWRMLAFSSANFILSMTKCWRSPARLKTPRHR